MNDPKTYLIIDTSNFLYKTFFMHIKESLDVNIAICHHVTLQSINKYFRKYKCDDVILAFDASSWRKVYTSSPDCITHQKYKGKRRSNLTPTEKERMAKFDEHIPQFMEMFQTLSSLTVLYRPLLEADDLIAGFIQNHPDDHHIVLSADKDFMQLLGRNNVTLINPVDDKERTLKDFDDDPYYFIYQKCFRGDSGDNVMSAYPRLRETKLKASYSDPVLRTNLMKHEFTSIVNNEDGSLPSEYDYITEDIFWENELLMDLTKQPDAIRNMIDDTITQAESNRGRFHYIKFLQYCGKYGLDGIRDKVDEYVPLLTLNKKKAA